MIAAFEREGLMSVQQEEKGSAPDSTSAPEKLIELHGDETLTDLFDRMDREAFRRSLELRDSRLMAHGARRR
jgi:hypothetical protein